MAIQKSSIPILEYDDHPDGLIRHDTEPAVQLPKTAVFAFLGDTIERYAVHVQAETIALFETITKNYPIYRINHQGHSLCLCQAPLGGAASAQIMDWLIGHGVSHIVSAGSCGALAPLPENAFLVPAKALRDEGTSYHYLPPSRYVETSEEIRNVIKTVLHRRGLTYAECTTWTTDGFFRETKEMVSYRRAEGCLTVEMECAALAACAKFRGAEFAQLLYTADSLADAQNYDKRGWGANSLEPALSLCLDVAVAIEKSKS